MNRVLSIIPFFLILGCAQFGGVESESKQGFIPELMTLGSSEEPMTGEEIAGHQAKYYTTSTKALYFETIAESSIASPVKKAYKRKALKAKEIALSIEEQVQTAN